MADEQGEKQADRTASRIPGLEIQTISAIPRDKLVGEVKARKDAGERLVQIAATKLDAGHEVTYSFDLDGRYASLRVTIADGEEVPSVTGVYWAAFAYENEIHDLFGIGFPGLVLDYHGAFYRTRVKFPFQAPPGRKTAP